MLCGEAGDCNKRSSRRLPSGWTRPVTEDTEDTALPTPATGDFTISQSCCSSGLLSSLFRHNLQLYLYCRPKSVDTVHAILSYVPQCRPEVEAAAESVAKLCQYSVKPRAGSTVTPFYLLLESSLLVELLSAGRCKTRSVSQSRHTPEYEEKLRRAPCVRREMRDW